MFTSKMPGKMQGSLGSECKRNTNTEASKDITYIRVHRQLNIILHSLLILITLICLKALLWYHSYSIKLPFSSTRQDQRDQF